MSPRDFCKSCVSLLFRYGMWEFFWAKAAMTSPKQERLLLICCASFSLSPVASDRSTLSLPARSTKYKQLFVASPESSSPFTCTIKILQRYIVKWMKQCAGIKLTHPSLHHKKIMGCLQNPTLVEGDYKF
jgi:hypothetical protein